MLGIAIGCVLGCAVWCGVLLRLNVARRRARTEPAVAAPTRRTARIGVAEHDRVRPAIDAAGARVWLDSDEAFWHEIVSWPSPRRTDSTLRTGEAQAG
jgi:hypothetical protein